MTVVIDPSGYVEAAGELSAAQRSVVQVVEGLRSGLSDTGTMGGNDDAGARFGRDYDAAAGSLIAGLEDLRIGAGVLGRRLVDTANVWSDAEHYASAGMASPGASWVSVDVSVGYGCSTVVAPVAVGESMGLPAGWEWIQSVCGAVWPNGDPGRLRNAASSWRTAGEDLRAAANHVSLAQVAMAENTTPELGLAYATLQEYRGNLTSLADGCTGLGEACDEYANGLDEAHQGILQELTELLAVTIVLEAGGVLLAAFSFGASAVLGNAAVMARIGMAGTRVTAIIARLAEVAGSVASKLSGVGVAAARVTGLMQDLRVVRTLTFVGNKSPRWLKLTAGIALNTGIAVGVDALANGGRVENLGADLAAGVVPVGLGKAVAGLKIPAGATAVAGAASKLADASKNIALVGGVYRIEKFEVIFKRNPKHDLVEFDRQLAGQEAGLSRMTVAEFLKNRNAVLARIESGGQSRSADGNAAQQIARGQAFRDKIEDLMIDHGLSRSEATARATQWLKGQAALHNPDQIAAGNPKLVDGVGDGRINSSIGAQWRTRIDGLDRFIRDVASRMSQTEREHTYIHVKLSR